MFVIAIRMMRDKFKSFVIYSIAAIGFLEMYIVLFPTISKQASQFDELLKVMPAEIFKAMNIDLSSISFGNIESYMSTEYLSFLWPILAIVFAVLLANYIVVNEIDKGTIETLISLPVKRYRIFTERYMAGLIILASFCVVSIFSIIPLAMIHNTEFIFENYVTTSIGSFLFVWAIYSLGVLFSVIFSEKGKSSMATGGVLIIMYVINIIASLQDNLKNLQYFSFFKYFNGSDLLSKNIYPEYSFLVLGSSAVVLMIIALILFEHRDLSA